MSARVLVVGASGTLGSALCDVLAELERDFEALDRDALDITDERAVQRAVERFARRTTAAEADPAAVLINAAAYTDVEGAESDPATAFLVNEYGARLLARHCRGAGLALVHVSTDFVFDGVLDRPYVETDEPAPLGIYGASKLAGERAAVAEYPATLIVRTAWVYSRHSGFPHRILDLAATRDHLEVVTDERGSPTYAPDLARAILDLHDAVPGAGLFHLAGAGSCTRFELAEETLRVVRSDVGVRATTAARLAAAVRRPANSALDCSKAAAHGVALRPWRDALRDAFEPEPWRIP